MSLRCVLIAGLLAIVAGSARGDVIILRSGDVHVGELVRRTPAAVVFRTMIDGRWTDLRVEVHDVDRLFEDPGNQGDDRASGRDAPVATQPAPSPEDDGGHFVAVVPLHGRVGGLVEGSVQGTFDAALLRHALDRAEADGAEAVVLDIDSPGGYLREMEAICRLIIDRSESMRIVAYPRDALSAAAVIALACPELVVRDGSRIGAAVMVQQTPDGLSAVDAKLASPHHATQRQLMAASGRPYALLAAMTIQERQLWWSPAAGLVDRPERAAQLTDARLVDGPATVLTMVADDAERWGVAVGRADDAVGLPAVLELESTRVVDYASLVDAEVRRTDQRVHRVLQQFGAYFQALGRIQQTLVRLERPGGPGRDGLRRTLGEAQRAARSIRRQDGTLLGERVDVPDSLIEQLARDGDALAAIAASTRGEREDLTRARAGVEAMLERWRALLARPTPGP